MASFRGRRSALADGAVGERMTPKALWTLAITSVAVFMVTLDNLVVTTAIPVIREDLHASLSGLQWTVNAYTLTFAVLLLTGAALGDRFGRRRLLAIGVAIFTAASAAAALAPSIIALDVARALQGVGGAIVMPLTLTILSAAVPRAGVGWRSGSGVASAGLLSPSGRWSAARSSVASRGTGSSGSTSRSACTSAPHPAAPRRVPRPVAKFDLVGLGLASAGLVGIVWGLVRANEVGWTSPQIIGAFVVGSALLAAFVVWELHTEHPMLPMRFFANRTFALANISSLFMFFGMFGSIFFIAQFFQAVQGLSPFQSGLRILPWTAMPMLVAPVAGARLDRIGGHRLMGPVWRSRRSALPGSPRSRRRPRHTSTSSARSRFRAWAWRCSSRRSPSRPVLGPSVKRKDKRPAPTTRSANSVACSASPCWRPCSPPRAAMAPASSSSTA